MNPGFQILARSRGFTLVELMVALAIGLFLIAGVFTAYVNGKRSQNTVSDQVAMVDNARFALETINADLRQAGVFGRVLPKFDGTEVLNINTASAPAIATECVAGWTFNVNIPLQAYDSNNPYGANCSTGYMAGTDVLELHGTLRDPVPVADLVANQIYLNSDVNQAAFFAGTASPNLSAQARNYTFYAVAYYISSFTNTPADGIPSLRRASLQPDGTVSDQMLLSGIENFQVQLGLDTDADGAVNQYVNPSAATDMGQVKSVQVWLVIRSQEVDPLVITAAQTATMAGQNATFANDGRRRVVVGTSVKLRNINLNS